VAELLERLTGTPYDLVVLVNPNNPTGRLTPAADVRRILDGAPESTRIWIDEAYIDYADPDATCERATTGRPNVVVCKSLSKAYALSGARVAYMVANAGAASQVRRITPPWVVSLPAQVAAVAALQDEAFYRARWAETIRLRSRLAAELQEAIPGLAVFDTCANFVLCRLPDGGPSSDVVCERCRMQDVYLRDMGEMGQGLGPVFVRVAVANEGANFRVVAALRSALA
jgi:histidinol-phosphate/aromatic aminotransferase/cobyric acid decarboxylase-like protein